MPGIASRPDLFARFPTRGVLSLLPNEKEGQRSSFDTVDEIKSESQKILLLDYGNPLSDGILKVAES